MISPQLRKPKIRIIGIDESLSEADLLETIKSQNETLIGDDISVITIYENKHKNNFGAILQCGPISFNNIMSVEKLNIGWNRCKVYECINVKRCFKCCGFNHKSNECKNRQSCLKCAEDHNIKDCKAQITNCVNCKSANKKFKLKLDINHTAYSDQCTILAKKLDIERKNVLYSS